MAGEDARTAVVPALVTVLEAASKGRLPPRLAAPPGSWSARGTLSGPGFWADKTEVIVRIRWTPVRVEKIPWPKSKLLAGVLLLAPALPVSTIADVPPRA